MRDLLANLQDAAENTLQILIDSDQTEDENGQEFEDITALKAASHAAATWLVKN